MTIPHRTPLSRLALAALAPLTLAAPAFATDFTDNVSIQAPRLCVGSACLPAVVESSWGAEGLKIKSATPSIRFEDTTPEATGNRDWNISVNNNTANENLYVYDVEAGTTPFWIDGGAPSHALHISDTFGRIGLGTTMPYARLHIVDGDNPGIYFEQDGSNGDTPHDWRLFGNDFGFFLRNETDGVTPFYVAADAPDAMLTLTPEGNVGIGGPIAEPIARVHLMRDDGTAQIRVDEYSTTSNPRTLLTLSNNGRPEIVMANTATNGEWSFGAGTDFFLKTGTVGSTSGAKTKVFTVKQNGDAIVFGTLTTGGTTCGTGCDRVFADDYALPSIADHAADMKRLGHLPNVGPTIEGEPINITDKLGRVLNELEHAHLYIADQEERLAAQGARMAAQDARIARLERLLEAGTE